MRACFLRASIYKESLVVLVRGIRVCVAASEELYGFAGVYIPSGIMQPIFTVVPGAAGFVVVGVPPHVPVSSKEVQDLQGHSIALRVYLFVLWVWRILLGSPGDC